MKALQDGDLCALAELEKLGADIKSIAGQNRPVLDKLLEKVILQLDHLAGTEDEDEDAKEDCVHQAIRDLRACLSYGACLTARAQEELDDKFATAIEKKEFTVAEELRMAGAFLREDRNKAENVMQESLENALQYKKWGEACQITKLGEEVPDHFLPTLHESLEDSLIMGRFLDADRLKALGAKLPEGCQEKELLGQGLEWAVTSRNYAQVERFLSRGATVSATVIETVQNRQGCPQDADVISALLKTLEEVRAANLSAQEQDDLNSQFYQSVIYGNYEDAQSFKKRGAKVLAGALGVLQTAQREAEQSRDAVTLSIINSLIPSDPAVSHSEEAAEAPREKQVLVSQATLDRNYHQAIQNCEYGIARRWKIQGANPSVEDQQLLKQEWASTLSNTSTGGNSIWMLRKLIGQPSDAEWKQLDECLSSCIEIKNFSKADDYINLGADLEMAWKAIKKPDAECVHWFLEKGLSRGAVVETLESSVTNYNLCVYRKQRDQAQEQLAIVQALIEAGADITEKTGKQMGVALHNAIQDGDMGMAQAWINMKAPILDHTQIVMNRFLAKARREGRAEEAEVWVSLGARQE